MYIGIPLEVGNLDGLLTIIFLIMLGPPLVLVLIGVLSQKKNKKIAKVCYILAGVYLVVSLGICSGALGGF
ncbi:hypothetical protein [Maribacter sp. 2-571]|uniref:hypothetical protein n=1 Tax=Maribacter sp. 2-571 TaxID=3417569 RepID=UPI003D356DFA